MRCNLADVLLTHSYHLPYDPKQLRKMQPYPPLGLLYAASALRVRGISVAVFDPMLLDPDTHFKTALETHRPRIVAVYEDDFNFLSKMCLTRMRGVAWEISRMARAIGAKVISHGSDAADHPALFLDNGFNYVLRGEAEETLAQLCSAILRGDDVGAVEGLVRRNEREKLVVHPTAMAKNPQWSSLPAPSRDLIDLLPYREAWTGAHGYFSMNMVSSRGCPYRCNWCAKPISGNKFRLRSATSVAGEMKWLKVEAGVQHIWFADDVFALDADWMQRFEMEVQAQDAVVPFKIQSRADLMSERTVRALKAAGCAEVWMGVESGSQAVLNAMDKGLKLASVYSARERLRDAGIRTCYFLQFGYPGESWQELQETIKLVRDTKPDDIGVSFSYPLPGTPFYERVQAELGWKRNWSDSDDLCILFKASHTTEFYRAVRDALHAEVDSWQAPAVDATAVAHIQALWRRIHELEPISRNSDSICLTARESTPQVTSAIFPLSELVPATED